MQDSIECWRNGEFCDGSIASRTAKGIRRYARLSGYKNKFETKMSVSRRRRCAQMLQQSQSFCTTILFKSQDWCSTGHGSHTPLQDDGYMPMMDLAQSLQTWCVRTQNWCEHVAASICADEEELTVAQRPSWYSDTYTETETETGIETETYSCQWSWTSRRMHNLSETKERWTSSRHFSRWTDHDSNEQSKSNWQSKSNEQSNKQ